LQTMVPSHVYCKTRKVFEIRRDRSSMNAFCFSICDVFGPQKISARNFNSMPLLK
jgi:hypothetical protein